MGDKLFEFEESNFDWLIGKFIEIETIRTQWEDFVYSEYQKTEEAPEEDR